MIERREVMGPVPFLQAISTGITNAMMESNAKGGVRIETPYLRIPYRSYEKPPIRAYGHTRPGKTGEGYKPIGYFEGE